MLPRRRRVIVLILLVASLFAALVLVLRVGIVYFGGSGSATLHCKVVYTGVDGVGFVERKGLAIVDGNGTIYLACNMSKVASLGSTYDMYASCFKRFYVNSDGVIYGLCVNRTGVVLAGDWGATYVDIASVIGDGVLVQLAPCVRGSCFAALFANDTGVYVAVYRLKDGSFSVNVYRSNSLVLTYLNGSIVGSLYDVRYNESIFVDVISGKVLFYVPATKALSSIGRVFVEPVLANGTLRVVLVVSSGFGVQYFVTTPNSLRFSALDRPIAASPSMDYFIVRNDTMGCTIVLNDGTTLPTRYPVSVLDMRSLMLAEPREAVIYADSRGHVVLVRVFEGGGASVVLIENGINGHRKCTMWRGEAKAISKVFAWYCGSAVVVADLSSRKLYLVKLTSCE